ncbi:unnamed protein product [Ascophyllum nodosum]
MFKFSFYPSNAADEDQPTLYPDSGPKNVPATAHTARQLDPKASIDDAEITATAAGAQIAWRRGDITLLRTVLTPRACPAIPNESDLVQGVYEGGLKVWEASLDLVEYLVASSIGKAKSFASDQEINGTSSKTGKVKLHCLRSDERAPTSPDPGRPRQNGTDSSHVTRRRKQVLELGCGHGLPGIMALRQGFQVCFSDFNSEVIEQVTVPNVRLNVPDRFWDLAEYYSGDWNSLSPLLDERDGGGRFDLILTAETLYTTAVADKIIEMILRHLGRDGHALVASKRFYFGTGGSTQYFREQATLDGRLACVDVSILNDGKSNIREVLRVSWIEGRGPSEEAR